MASVGKTTEKKPASETEALAAAKLEAEIPDEFKETLETTTDLDRQMEIARTD